MGVHDRSTPADNDRESYTHSLLASSYEPDRTRIDVWLRRR